MTQHLPRFYRHQQEAQDHATITRILIETGADTPTHIITVTSATLAGDNRRLRGLPAIARGVAGVSPGTDPYQALADKERRAA